MSDQVILIGIGVLVGILAILGVGIMFIGYWIFKKLEKRFAEEL